MIFAILLSLPLVSASSDEVIINRPLNRVEFSDLLLEYNHNYADEPTNAVEVKVALSMEQAKWTMGSYKDLALILELYESWRDSRLRFRGESSVIVPHGTVLWMPDTYFVNTLDTQWQTESSLRLRHDGTIFRKRRVKVVVPCDAEMKLILQNEQMNCTLVLGSFDNAGASSISYRVMNVSFSEESQQNIKFSAEYANSTSTVQTFDGETLSRTTVIFSADITHLLLSRKIEF